MKDRSTVTVMVLIHLLQCKAWLNAMLEFKKPVQKFKQLSNLALSGVTNLLNFIEKAHPDEYELSAEISDSILKLVELSEENQQKVYDFIEALESEEKIKKVA